MPSSDKDRVSRLLSYKNLLERFKSMGFNKVFSDNIADALDISSSLVRKDFSSFDIKGIQKGGYHVDEVLEKINKIIGYEDVQQVIIVGIGRIGEALTKYKGFARDNIRVSAGFDTDTTKINEVINPPIFHSDKMVSFIKNNKIKLAILSVPEAVAQQTADILETAGIKGILNFTPVQLKNSEKLCVNNVNLESELANLIYFINK